MNIIKTKTLTENQFIQINQMWNEEYPEKLKDRFPILLEGVSSYNHYLITDENKNVNAWAVDFVKDNEIRFSIIIHKNHQKKGLGSMLVEKLKNDLPEFYGWVIDHSNDKKLNGENYHSPLLFYLKHGFEILHNNRIDNEMLNAVKIKWKRKL